MERKNYLVLLILTGILSQRIGTLSEINIKKSSYFQVRKKRVVDRTPNGDRPSSIVEVPYIVNILRNEQNICGGSILAPAFILTAAHCVFVNGTYMVLSNSAVSYRGNPHCLIRKIIHPEYEQRRFMNDLAVIIIFPIINFETSRNKPIKLYKGLLPPNSHGTVSGWGCHRVEDGDNRSYPFILRTITVPIIDLESCQHAYPHEVTQITERCICTYYPDREKFCGDGDSGGALVVNNRLVGVMAWSENFSIIEGPDVFMNMLYSKYKKWVISSVRNSTFIS